MSEANRVAFLYLEETSYGVTPASALTEFNRASDSFGQNPSSRISTTIRSDRATQDSIRENIAPAGDVAYNMAYGAPDAFVEGVMMSDWSNDLNLSGDVSVVASGQKFVSNHSTTGPQLSGITVGQWIKVAGHLATNNNGYFRVTGKDTSVDAAEFITVDGGSTLTDATAHAATIKGSVIFNGTTLKSYSIEKEFLDLSNIFDSFTGVRVGKMSMTIRTAGAIGGTFNFQGQKAGTSGSATIGTGANVAPTTTQEINANDHVSKVIKDGAVATFSVAEMVINITNALRQKGRVGLLGPFDIGVGRITVDGTLNCYFEDRAMLNAARAYSQIGLATQLKDDVGNVYIFDLPAARVWGGDPAVTGTDTDVMSQYNFQARIDSVSGKMVSFNRFAA